ncbi:hypothetical protein HPB52_011695 [Rhipicephalus sanguineus]|uniref:TNase-like domain-containing protein n=1 Tax=Rhipicephalus sanguineus TaxID=34632 RepID=A0A9D4PEC4_RHISA|nr:hypothetical protein HPB52_011695 [Rhipicephalus sanguineus]
MPGDTIKEELVQQVQCVIAARLRHASGENVAESLVHAGLVDVRTGGKGEAQQRLRELQEEAQAAGRGKHGPDAASHVRDVKWTLRDGEDPRTFADRFGKKPVPAVVEHVRDGSTVRVLLLPDFHYITLMLSGIRCPSSRPGEPESQYSEEAKYFTESRLLQRDVEVVLEGATNQNFVGTVLHPNGNIAEHLLRAGFARCVDWSLASVTGGADRLRAAEKEAKEKRLRLWKDYTPTGIPIDAKEQRFEGKVVEVINADALVVKVGDNELRKIFLSSIRPPRRPEEPKEAAPGGGGKERNFRPLYDIPFMYEAREFLRKKLIGKQVQVCIDYKQPASNSFPEKTCCTVTIGGINVAEALVGKGLATVVRYRQDDDQRSAHYNDLLAAEMKAQKSARGLHSKKDASVHRVVDLAGHPRYDRFFSRNTTTSELEIVSSVCISSIVFVTATAILLTHLTHDFFAGELCGLSRCAVTVYVILEGYRSVYRELLGKLIPKLWVELCFVVAVSRRPAFCQQLLMVLALTFHHGPVSISAA